MSLFPPVGLDLHRLPPLRLPVLPSLPPLSALHASLPKCPFALGSLAAAALASGALLVSVIRSYRRWLLLGPGELPYNFIGYLAQAACWPFISPSDSEAIDSFSNPDNVWSYPEGGRRSFLRARLPRRPRDRPNVPDFVAPQRQMTQRATTAERAKMEAVLEKIVQEDKDTHGVLRLERSETDPERAVAILLVPSEDRPLPDHFNGRKEIAHLHPVDGSAHVVLSLLDAEKVISSGWGLRHKLAGHGLATSYCMVYAANEEEFVHWEDIVRGAVMFCTSEWRLGDRVRHGRSQPALTNFPQ